MKIGYLVDIRDTKETVIEKKKSNGDSKLIHCVKSIKFVSRNHSDL